MAAKKDPFSHPFGTLYGDNFTKAVFVDGAYSYGGAAEPVAHF